MTWVVEFDGGVLLMNLQEPAVSDSDSESTVTKNRQTTVKRYQPRNGYERSVYIYIFYFFLLILRMLLSLIMDLKTGMQNDWIEVAKWV